MAQRKASGSEPGHVPRHRVRVLVRVRSSLFVGIRGQGEEEEKQLRTNRSILVWSCRKTIPCLIIIPWLNLQVRMRSRSMPPDIQGPFCCTESSLRCCALQT